MGDTLTLLYFRTKRITPAFNFIFHIDFMIDGGKSKNINLVSKRIHIFPDYTKLQIT